LAIVASSDLITNAEEARDYYRAKLGGIRRVTCHGKQVTINFPVEVVHLYSAEGVAGPSDTICTQQIGVGKFDVRVFNLRRAKLLDFVLPAISQCTVSIVGKKGNKVLHGQKLADGCYVRVVLRRGPRKIWVCVSAFPIDERAYTQAKNSKDAIKFPP